MKILTKVNVKHILTEKSKENLFQSFTERKGRLQNEVEQFKFELKRAEKSLESQKFRIIQFYEKEIRNRKEKIKQLDFQLEQLEILPIGFELNESELQGMIDVKVGDNWNKIRTEQSIIVKDGIIVDIR